MLNHKGKHNWGTVRMNGKQLAVAGRIVTSELEPSAMVTVRDIEPTSRAPPVARANQVPMKASSSYYTERKLLRNRRYE
jgi:hypothetical protein